MVIGLTGGIASGKSTVAGFFREMGAVVVDADTLAHEVIRRGEPPFQQVVARFGEGILGEDGEIDRKKLGQIVFRDRQALQELNQIVHPAVYARWRRLKGELQKSHPRGVVLFEVPLLIESGGQGEVDRLIVVWAERDEQIRRLQQREGYSREESERRVDLQMPLSEKVRYADEVIDGGRPPEEVRREAEMLFGRFARLAAGEAPIPKRGRNP